MTELSPIRAIIGEVAGSYPANTVPPVGLPVNTPNRFNAVVASTTTLSLAGTPIIDGYQTVVGDRVLAAGQTTASANGVYVVATGGWSRAIDLSQASQFLGPVRVSIERGTANRNRTFGFNPPFGFSFGVTPITFEEAPDTFLLDPRISRVIECISSIPASRPPYMFKTITEACAWADANWPLNPTGPGDFTRGTIICTGLFNEQAILPVDITIRGKAMGQFDWECTGPRPLGNFVCKPTFGNWIIDTRFWLSATETDETIFCDNGTRYLILINVHGVSRIPPGGDAVTPGLGKSRFLTRIADIWPFTCLGWNVLVDGDGIYTGDNALIRLINTDAANGSHFADFRFWNLNVDGLFTGSGALVYLENIKDVWFMAPQFLGNVSGSTDNLIRMKRTILTGADKHNFVHLIGGSGTPWSALNDIGGGCGISFEHTGAGIEGGPVDLKGDALSVGIYSAGGAVVRRSPDILSVNNVPGGTLTKTTAGAIRAKIIRPGGTPGPILYHACQPGYTGSFNAMLDLINKNAVEDNFYSYGLVLRNPTTNEAYLFGMRSGTELHLSFWSSSGTVLTTPNVRAVRVYRDIPRLFGCFREPNGDVTFELRDFDNTPASQFHTLPSSTPNLAGFTQLGIGLGNENAAGEGADIHILINNFVGIP
jgi:hypothetical protein